MLAFELNEHGCVSLSKNIAGAGFETNIPLAICLGGGLCCSAYSPSIPQNMRRIQLIF